MHSVAGFWCGAHMQPRSVQFKWGFVRSTVTESQQPAWAGKAWLRLEEGHVVLAEHDARGGHRVARMVAPCGMAWTNGNPVVADGGSRIDRLIFNVAAAFNILDLTNPAPEIFELATD